MAGKGQKHEGQRVVAIAVDDSEFSEQALDFYAANAKRDDDYVVLIHCPELYDLSMASPAVVDQLLKELQSKVTALEKKFKEKILGMKMTGKFRTGQGKPGEVICDVAKEEGASLIVCGTRGLGKIRRTFLGSVSPAVVDQLMRELQAKVEALENKYKERIQKINLCGKFRTGQGKPGEIICRVAQEEDATMIICGTRGLGKIRRTIMGSVSDYVIHHSHVPVLVCRHN